MDTNHQNSFQDKPKAIPKETKTPVTSESNLPFIFTQAPLQINRCVTSAHAVFDLWCRLSLNITVSIFSLIFKQYYLCSQVEGG